MCCGRSSQQIAALNPSERETVPNQLGIESPKFLNLKADVIGTAKTFPESGVELKKFPTESRLSILKFRLLIALQYSG